MLVITKNLGAFDLTRRGWKAWKRTKGPMVLTSKCLRTWSAGVSRTFATMSSNPAFETRVSMCSIPCLVLSSSTAAAGSESTVESILTVTILEPDPTGREEKTLLAEATSRTAATIVVEGRWIKAVRRPSPIPRLAPVMR